MADEKKLTKEEEELMEKFKDQQTKLGEIYSQCWESEEFKKAFIDDPKAIFEEYGVEYDKNTDYVIIDTPAKTIINVLPCKGIKGALKTYTDKLNKMVEDLADDDEKQLLLEDWCWMTYQNTKNKTYLPIPLSPESLTAEELEMVNGGCIIVGVVFLVGALAFFAGAVQSVAAVTTAVTMFEAITAQIGVTNAIVLNWSVAVGGDGSDIGSSTSTWTKSV